MFLQASVLAIVLLVQVNGDYPLTLQDVDSLPSFAELQRNTEEVYRLPQNVLPLEYDIYLDLYFDEQTDKPYSFEGKVYITIQALEENVNQIVLHANVGSIGDVTLFNDAGFPVNLNVRQPLETEETYHFLKINTADALTAGANYSLVIEYSNSMNDGPMKRGIWRGWYRDDDDNIKIYATTHFQPYNARQAFPCWDEPFFKAVFTLHITRPSSYLGIFSNTNVMTHRFVGTNRLQANFFPTPKMSSYLLTFLVSESFQVIAQDTTFNPPIRIIGRSNSVGLGDHALELAVKMTEYFNEYFGIDYADLHEYLLNDHVSSPDWASAGTENWGMVSYRELHLLIDPRETLTSVEHYGATLVSHELAHKWFGNLVTCYWWSNTWINEGFASYFGYMATHQMFPKYELHEHFNSRYLQNSLSFDSGVSTVPLNHDVNTPAQVTGHFGTISYSKGASFLRMTENIISPDTFQKACRYFLNDNAYEPTDQYDLLYAFTNATSDDNSLDYLEDFDFRNYYDIWVNQPGYPLLSVNVNHGTGDMSLTQERFFLSASATPTGQIYPIPINYAHKSSPDFSDLKLIEIMASETMTVSKDPGEEWVIFNIQQHGHYRVTYDDRTWDLIAEALLNERETIHYLNRAQIVNDVFALMRSTRMTYNKGFSILRFLANEDNYHVWNPAISGYTWLRNRLRHIPESSQLFDEYLLDQMAHVIETYSKDIPDDETLTESMTRSEIFHFVCLIGHERCQTELRDKFIALRNNNVWIDPRLRRIVYISGIHEGGKEDFDFLLNRFRQSNLANDQLEMLRALATTPDRDLLLEYLSLTLTQEVRYHDKATSFNYALLGNTRNVDVILQFVKDNIDVIRQEYVEDSPPTPVATILSNLATYLDEPGLVEYEEWLRETQSGSRQYASTLSSINSARTNMEWGTANADVIIGAARGSATTSVISAVLLMTTILIAMII